MTAKMKHHRFHCLLCSMLPLLNADVLHRPLAILKWTESFIINYAHSPKKIWSKSFGHLNIKYYHDFSELVNAQRIVLEELRAEEQQNALQTSYLFVKQIIIIVHSFISHSVCLLIHFVAVERQWNIEIVNNFARVHVLWSKSDDSMRK